ncbi:MAG TPA: hypothetical protein VHA30_01610 [Patescibacteria group bacterium]|nr:hypothetical protein [Patescibacteria group bacterium]
MKPGVSPSLPRELALPGYDVRLALQHTAQGWGLLGFYEGYRLVFSGTFNSWRLFQERWLKFSMPRRPNPSQVGTIDIYELFSPSARLAWRRAAARARRGRRTVGAEDIFLSLLRSDSVKNLLRRLKVSAGVAEQFLTNYLRLSPPASMQAVQLAPLEAFLIAAKLHNHKIGTLMLLGALMQTLPAGHVLQAIFTNIGLTYDKLELFSVWRLNLNYDFPAGSPSAKMLYCCRQAQGLEEHFGYFYELPAIEAAVRLSAGQTLKDLEHKQALALLIRAGLLAAARQSRTVTESLVNQAAARQS